MRKTREWSIEIDSMLAEPNHPAVDRFRRHREGYRIDHAAACASASGHDERKERENCTRTSGSVAVIEMIGSGVVEVHGLLHEPKAKNLGVEIDVGLRIDGDRRDVMNAGNCLGQTITPRLRSALLDAAYAH